MYLCVTQGSEWWLCEARTSGKYDSRNGDLFVLGWARVCRCALIGINASDVLTEGLYKCDVFVYSINYVFIF